VARLLIITSSPHFVEGGHLVVARALVRAAREAGHEAELWRTPQNRFGRQGGAYLTAWLTDVAVAADDARIDQVITMRYPSYAVRHPQHVCWLNHRMREYYDQWDRFSGLLPWPSRVKEGARRRVVHAVDRYLLTRNVSRLFVQSKTIEGRLARWGGIPSEVLYPPPPLRPYRCDGYGDYLFAYSRFTPLKRLDLVLQALGQPEAAGIRCVIAGEGPDEARLDQLRRRLGLEDRVTLAGRIDEATLVEHLARCRAVVFPPFDEDYGFVTVEAFSAGKPVLTCVDSGGPAELVRDGENGWATAATPVALAQAMREAMDDPAGAERRGDAGRNDAARLTWPDTLNRLLL
jgi:glycosyltransferase involved in cell wall biosynthesis